MKFFSPTPPFPPQTETSGPDSIAYDQLGAAKKLLELIITVRVLVVNSAGENVDRDMVQKDIDTKLAEFLPLALIARYEDFDVLSSLDVRTEAGRERAYAQIETSIQASLQIINSLEDDPDTYPKPIPRQLEAAEAMVALLLDVNDLVTSSFQENVDLFKIQTNVDQRLAELQLLSPIAEYEGIDVLTSIDVFNSSASEAILKGVDFALVSLSKLVTELTELQVDHHIIGGADNDLITTGAGDDKIHGRAGDDTIAAGAGDDILQGGTGKDKLEGGSGEDLLHGNQGRDSLNGGAGEDVIYGGNGADLLVGGTGKDLLYGGAQKDVYLFDRGFGHDIVHDHDGDIIRFGTSFKSYQVVLERGTIEDGTLDDLFVVAHQDTVQLDGFFLTEGLNSGAHTGNYGAIEFLSEISNEGFLIGTGNADKLVGTRESEHIYAFEGDDVIFGGDGDDNLIGGDGDDLLFGGAGNDNVAGGSGEDKLYGGGGRDNLVGGEGDDILWGGADNDTLIAGSGDNLMFGSAGDDVLVGGYGNDHLHGGTGADRLIVHNGNNVLRGGDGDDTLDGSSGDDVFYGGNGNDAITAGPGRDLLHGGNGDDRFIFRDASRFPNDPADVIVDFEGAGREGGDVIDLRLSPETTINGARGFTFLGELSWEEGMAAGSGAVWIQDFGTQTRVFCLTNNDNVVDLAVRINDGIDATASDYISSDFLL